MAKKPRENRVPIMMSDAELEAIDQWREANGIKTRSDAVRRLVQNAIRTDQEIDGVYRLTRSVFQEVSTGHQMVSDEVKTDGKTDWNRIGKMALASYGTLVKEAGRLSIAVNSITEQVHRLRKEGDLTDLSREADSIRDTAKDRAKMFRVYMKAIEEGDFDVADDDE